MLSISISLVKRLNYRLSELVAPLNAVEISDSWFPRGKLMNKRGRAMILI